jgi:hypothetical protein
MKGLLPGPLGLIRQLVNGGVRGSGFPEEDTALARPTTTAGLLGLLKSPKHPVAVLSRRRSLVSCEALVLAAWRSCPPRRRQIPRPAWRAGGSSSRPASSGSCWLGNHRTKAVHEPPKEEEMALYEAFDGPMTILHGPRPPAEPPQPQHKPPPPLARNSAGLHRLSVAGPPHQGPPAVPRRFITLSDPNVRQ